MDPLCHYTRAEAALEHIIPSAPAHEPIRADARSAGEPRVDRLRQPSTRRRPEELLLEELTALMDDARSGSTGSENRLLLLTVDATNGRRRQTSRA